MMSPSRRTIIQTYLEVKTDPKVNPVKAVATKLGYTLDQNHSNSHVATVIRTFIQATEGMDK